MIDINFQLYDDYSTGIIEILFDILQYLSLDPSTLNEIITIINKESTKTNDQLESIHSSNESNQSENETNNSN